MKWILILGPTGAGKTTLAKRLASNLHLNHIELDSLHWGPGWSETPKEQFLVQLTQKMATNRCVIDGNYSFARKTIWPKADTAIWLDYPLPIILWRLFHRTIRRTISQEELWNGNREQFRNQFFSKESLFLWAIKSQRKHRTQYPTLFSSPAYNHIRLFRHRHPSDTNRWLKTTKNSLHS